MLQRVGEAAVDRTITVVVRTITAAAHHLHSAAGAVILVATPVGGPDLRALRDGAAEAVVVAGAGAAVVRPKDGSEDRENTALTEE